MKRIDRWADIALFCWIGAALQSRFSHSESFFLGLSFTFLIVLIVHRVREIRVLKKKVEVSGEVVRKSVSTEPVDMDRPAKINFKNINLTAEQLVLVERINSKENDRRFQDMIELWESIYGQPADLTRPIHDIVAEVSIALSEKSS